MRFMVQPRLCVDILQHLAAAEAALSRISLAVLPFHVERCDPLVSRRRAGTLAKISELVDIFDRFAK